VPGYEKARSGLLTVQQPHPPRNKPGTERLTLLESAVDLKLPWETMHDNRNDIFKTAFQSSHAEFTGVSWKPGLLWTKTFRRKREKHSDMIQPILW
jgi:hypothetical protein